MRVFFSRCSVNKNGVNGLSGYYSVFVCPKWIDQHAVNEVISVYHVAVICTTIKQS